MLGGDDIGGFQTDGAGCSSRSGARRTVSSRRSTAVPRPQALADGARTAVAATAAMGAGALGLGALVTALATTAAADVSGMLAAGVLGALGMLILPAKRRRARAELETKVTDLRQRLADALRGEFVTARDRSAQRLADGIAPYTRFVRAEQGRWAGARSALSLADGCGDAELCRGCSDTLILTVTIWWCA